MRILSLIMTSLIAAPTALANGLEAGADGRCKWEYIDIHQKPDLLGRWDFANQCFTSRIVPNPLLKLIYDNLRPAVAAWVDDNTRPLFPTFIKSDNSNFWPAPKTAVASCAEHQEPFPTYLYLCSGGCERGNQFVLFADGYHRVSDALQFNQLNVVTVDAEKSSIKDSGAADLHFIENKVSKYTQDISSNPENELLMITTDRGGRLEVTPAHPLVTGLGKLVRAEQLKVGDKILHVSGETHAVTSIQHSVVEERVINLDVVTKEETSQIYVVQGYLSGSKRQQGLDLEQVNRSLYREQLPQLAGLID